MALRPAPVEAGGPRVSVVVATKDRPEQLAACLASLLALDHDSFEVVIVDQSAQPDTGLPNDARLHYLHSDSRGKSAGLNRGLIVARGEILAFTDDDCTVPADWLSRAESVLARSPDVSLVFGDLNAVDHDTSQFFVPDARFGRFQLRKGRLAAYHRGGAGADMIARRTLFEEIGGYDELIGPGAAFAACEEFDIYYRTLASGAAVAFAPEVETVHWGVRAYADGSGAKLKRQYAYGEGAVIGKHLRQRDAYMLLLFGRIIWEDLRYLAESVRHGRVTGGGTMVTKWRGVLAGMRVAVDRDRGVFRAPAAAQA